MDPTRVGDGSVSFPTAASAPRHRPFQIRSLLFFFSHLLFTQFLFYFRGGFFPPFFPLFRAGKAPQPGLAPRSVGCGIPAAARSLPPRPGRNAPGAGEAARADRGTGDNRGSPGTAAFDRCSAPSFAESSPKPWVPPTPTPTVHSQKRFASPRISPSGSAGAGLFPAGTESWGGGSG